MLCEPRPATPTSSAPAPASHEQRPPPRRRGSQMGEIVKRTEGGGGAHIPQGVAGQPGMRRHPRQRQRRPGGARLLPRWTRRPSVSRWRAGRADGSRHGRRWRWSGPAASAGRAGRAAAAASAAEATIAAGAGYPPWGGWAWPRRRRQRRHRPVAGRPRALHVAVTAATATTAVVAGGCGLAGGRAAHGPRPPRATAAPAVRGVSTRQWWRGYRLLVGDHRGDPVRRRYPAGATAAPLRRHSGGRSRPLGLGGARGGWA